MKEKDKLETSGSSIEQLQFPFGQQRFLSSLGTDKLKMGKQIQIKLGGKTLNLDDLLV